MKDEQKVIYAKTISWQVERTHGYVYILNNKNSKYYMLEDVGKEIWLCIEKEKDLTGIVKTISERFNTDLNIIKEDTRCFLDSLLNEGLICYEGLNNN